MLVIGLAVGAIMGLVCVLLGYPINTLPFWMTFGGYAIGHILGSIDN